MTLALAIGVNSAAFFSGGEAVGGIVRMRDEAIRIVGVVGDVRQVNLRDEPPPMIYHPVGGYSGYLEFLLFRVRGDGAAAADAVRAAVRRVAPEMPIGRTASSLTSMMERTTAVERLLGQLTGAFAALALLLAALGVYGLFSYGVARRTGELGLRQALGADRGDLVALVLRQAGAVLAGAYWPARRAARVSPAEALRHE